MVATLLVHRIASSRRAALTVTNGLTAEAATVIAGLSKLEELHLPNSTTVEGLKAVRGLANLRWLDPKDSVKITDAGMATLTDLQQLRRLTLPKQVGGAGFKAVCQLAGLEEIDQPGRAGTATPVGAEDIQHLARLPKLTTLKLPHVPFTVAMLDELQPVKSLKLLQVGTPRSMRRKGENATENTDAAIIRLKQAIPGLEVKR